MKCESCGFECKPRNAAFFFDKARSNRTGYETNCKKCRAGQLRRRRQTLGCL